MSISSFRDLACLGNAAAMGFAKSEKGSTARRLGKGSLNYKSFCQFGLFFAREIHRGAD